MKKFFIILLAVLTFFMFPITAHASSYEDYLKYIASADGDIKLISLECPLPNEIWGVSSDRYLVFYNHDEDQVYVWFISNKGTFRFADHDSTKTLYCTDLYGKCFKLNSTFDLDLEYDDAGNVISYLVDNLIAPTFNADRNSISFIYSTQDISVYFVESVNKDTTVYIPAGFNADVFPDDTNAPVERPEDSSTVVDDDTQTNILLRRILDALLWLPNYVLDGINNVITPKVTNLLNQIITILQELPDKILNGIKEIFSGLLVPDTDEIKSDVSAFKKSIFDSMGFDVEELETSMSEIEPESISDITIDLNIGGQVQTVKILDTQFLVIGVDYFRPYIRGFIMLMLFFNVMNHVASIVHIKGINGGDES